MWGRGWYDGHPTWAWGQGREGFLRERVELPRGRGKRKKSNSRFKDRYASIWYDYLTWGLFQISKHKPVTFGWVVCAIDNPTPVLASPKSIDQTLSIKSCSFYIKGVKVLWKKNHKHVCKKAAFNIFECWLLCFVFLESCRTCPTDQGFQGEVQFPGSALSPPPPSIGCPVSWSWKSFLPSCPRSCVTLRYIFDFTVIKFFLGLSSSQKQESH